MNNKKVFVLVCDKSAITVYCSKHHYALKNLHKHATNQVTLCVTCSSSTEVMDCSATTSKASACTSVLPSSGVLNSVVCSIKSCWTSLWFTSEVLELAATIVLLCQVHENCHTDAQFSCTASTPPDSPTNEYVFLSDAFSTVCT